ncbi:xanthine permease [Tenericutes bacterium MO-XQ]|nr:xanthine permease [Tenericutes bacterium MO-XQ]AUD63698.1 xanthine permease [Tenericutes bacterium MO-XQ]
MFKKLKGGTPWWVKGDLNGFFGLGSNVLTNFLAAIGLLVVIGMPSDIVFGSVVPGTAVAVGLGGIILAIQAKQYSIKKNKADVTAMPYGLSVPHYFVVAFGVIAVVYASTGDWQIAWAAGIVWNFIQGIIMATGAFVGIYIKKYIPRAAMLGALAGLAITYIAMNPAGQVFTTPYIGLTSLAIIFVGWFALKKMPFNIPAGAFAIIVGTILAWITGYMDPQAVSDSVSNVGFSFPGVFINLFGEGFRQIAPFLPAAIPLAIYDFLESLDNLESADVAGEHYNVPKAMLVPAGLTLLGSFLGSPFPTIIYIGHPGWKSTGARIGYSWVTGVTILLIGFLGFMNLILTIIPLIALLPILMYIGMVITTQAFATTEKKHMPAVALSFIPLIAGFVTLQIKNAIATTGMPLDYEALANTGIPLLGWERLAAGDILVGMMIATIAIYIIDKKYLLSAVYALITGGLAFFGFIHAPAIGWATGWEVALGYLAIAVVLVVMNYYRRQDNVVNESENS